MANELSNLSIPPSLRELAFQSIKNAILTNQLKSENIYKIEDLAKSLGISKTPVREALLDLSIKGFVTFLPRKGIQINLLDKNDIEYLYEFRTAMEIAVIKRIAKSISEESISALKSINAECKKSMEHDNKIEYLKNDRKFHLFLAELSENDYIISSLENVRDLVDWMGARALILKNRMEEVLLEHKNVIDMLERHDTVNAQKMMEKHIKITMEKVLETYLKEEKNEY